MIAAAFGLGPFNPAIRWYDRLWVAKVEFETEEEAITAAEGVVALLNGNATAYISGLNYEPQAR